jgi:hypothetical protein
MDAGVGNEMKLCSGIPMIDAAAVKLGLKTAMALFG